MLGTLSRGVRVAHAAFGWPHWLMIANLYDVAAEMRDLVADPVSYTHLTLPTIYSV